MEESRLKRILSTVKVEVNLSDLVKAAFISGVSTPAVATALSLSPEVVFPFSAALLFATSAIKVKITELPRPRTLPPDLADYVYLFHLRKELSPLIHRDSTE